MRGLALLCGVVVGAVVALSPLGEGGPTTGAGESIRLEWMSGAAFVRADVSGWFCPSAGPSSSHQGAWDLIADDNGADGCSWSWVINGQRPIYLDTRGTSSSTAHNTVAAFGYRLQGGTRICDIYHWNVVEIGSGILRGKMRYVHVVLHPSMLDGGGVNIPASPSGSQQSVEVGVLANDHQDGSGCSTGWHIHQDNWQQGQFRQQNGTCSSSTTSQRCLFGATNTTSNLPVGTVANVWGTTKWIHRWCYTEGVSGEPGGWC